MSLTAVVVLGRGELPGFESATELHPERIDRSWSSPIPPLPAPQGLDAERVALGRRLFHDPLLSSDRSVSCASCHDLKNGGDDGRRYSIGVGGAVGKINAPTVLNSRFNFRQFWDGRAATLAEQIDGPLEHPEEMGLSWEAVLTRLGDHAEYAPLFQQVYGGPPTRENVKDAIVTFEESLVTLDSPFDRFVRGETTALETAAQRGWELFQEVGCITCHQGVNAGGNMFQTFGSVGDYFADRGDIQGVDLGRFNVTGAERDRHRFKVPTLRNVEQTAPYFHDGSAATLEEAVQTMARYQLGEALAEQEVLELVAFLKSLTGELPPSVLGEGDQ